MYYPRRGQAPHGTDHRFVRHVIDSEAAKVAHDETENLYDNNLNSAGACTRDIDSPEQQLEAARDFYSDFAWESGSYSRVAPARKRGRFRKRPRHTKAQDRPERDAECVYDLRMPPSQYQAVLDREEQDEPSNHDCFPGINWNESRIGQRLVAAESFEVA